MKKFNPTYLPSPTEIYGNKIEKNMILCTNYQGFLLGTLPDFFFYFGNIENVNIIQTSRNLCIINVTQSYLICLDSGNFLVESIFAVQQFVFPLISNAFLIHFVKYLFNSLMMSIQHFLGIPYALLVYNMTKNTFNVSFSILRCPFCALSSILRSFFCFHRKLT